VDVGLSVSIDNTPFLLNDAHQTEKLQLGSCQFRLMSSFEFVVECDEFNIRIQNSDEFLNQDISVGSALQKRVTEYKHSVKRGDSESMVQKLIDSLPHGILGQTWRYKVYPNRWKYIEGTLVDYQVLDGVLDTNFKFTRFQKDETK